MILGLPLLGVWMAGLPLAVYLEFPPLTRYVSHPPFAWPAFLGVAGLIAVLVTPIIFRALWALSQPRTKKKPVARPFPWWGWLGVILGLFCWILAWTRFSWFASFQKHTFTPLWLCYILVVNGVCYRQIGRSMITHQTGLFLLLFPFSTLFWWGFEYLNRFVQNWYYLGTDYRGWTYVLFASISFSTVLPAVLSTRDWIRNCAWVRRGFQQWVILNVRRPKRLAWICLLVSGLVSLVIGVWPGYCFAMLWLVPFVVITALLSLHDRVHMLSSLAKGDWQEIVSAAAAALLCGWFWEMWNIGSLAHWEYAIPYVHRFKLFQMPILGYAGYLPFGLECAAAGLILNTLMQRWPRHFFKSP